MAKARQQYFADEVTLQKENRDFAIQPELVEKLESIEAGAQVNVIETVKVNGTALVPDTNKAVNVEVPDVIDNLFSTSTDDALSAKQGKVLYDYLQNIASRGRYLSNWNCVTGLAVTNPSENPYPYKAGDYYSVSNVAAIGGTNYRPDGAQYIIGQASTTVETELVSVSDFYLYDGTSWLLLANSARQIAVDSSLSTTSTNPVENRVVTNAINGKQDTLVAGTNIQIASDGKTISATDTTYSAGTNISIDANNEISAVDTTYTAGANIQISNQNVISATDTVYTAGTNVQINNNVISATDTTYTAGTGISIDSNNVISNTQTSAEWGNITGTLSSQTDLQNALDGKLDKVTSTATNPRAYVVNADGSQATLPITDSVTSGAIVRRNGTQITVPDTPSANTDAASKKYVDDQVSAATAGAVSDTAYGSSWDGVTGIAPSKNAVYDKISAMDTTISNNTLAISTINGKIPAEASATNQLADKDYVGDSINSVTAYYITKNATGDQWATRAELFAATTFYSGGVVRVPTKNDYTIVLSDEQHDNATTRYIYNNGWEYQYTVNETPLTQAQLDALNSGITSTKVGQYDTAVSTISGYGNIVTHNTSEFATATQGGKADTALQPNDNISELNNDAGYITGVNWGSVGGTLSNQVDLQNALNAKANDNAVVHTSGAETINGTKTFGTSPVVPNKTADATNTGTAIATEAQVYKKQDKLTTQTAYTSKGSATKVPQITTNTLGQVTGVTEVDIQTGETYNAGKGIEIGNDYSAMQGPAPVGFHVPTNNEWQAVYDAGKSLGAWPWSGGPNFRNYLKLPLAGYRGRRNSNVSMQGSSGYYWSSMRYDASCAYKLGFASSSITPQSYENRATATSIRPFKDVSVVPDSNWTVLYQGSGSSGIYHSPSLGLISISSDGSNWITIADKNLGATTVYNDGDTLSEANCGYYYQRGNNYGFPRTGSVTTSSTQVNASTYGPGNYYSSSTFITGSDDWSSAQNDNLWGGETGVIPDAITNTGVLSVNGQTGDVSLYSTTTVTLTSAGWSSNSQTVSVTGVTASNTVIVSPAPADIADYADCGVYCSAQANGTLTFGCDTAPSGDIVVNVLIMS